jgi:lipopolysaccharide export system protein LptA
VLLVAVAAVLLTLQTGPGPLDAVTPETGDELIPGGIGDDPVQGQNSFGEIDQGQYLLEQGEGGRVRRTLLTWDRMDPLPRGRSEVVRPVAIVFFSERRVLRITADEGTFLAPGNEPQLGVFRGDVQLTLFDAPAGEQVDLGSPRHVASRVYLDQPTRFDLQIGQISSPGPVHLTGPEVDFYGSGLTMSFNRLQDRIEQMTIERGRWLRFSMGSVDGDEAVGGDAVDPTESGEPDAAEQPGAVALDDAEPADGPGADQPRPGALVDAAPETLAQPQYYVVRFEQEVRVRPADGTSWMMGDALEVAFALDGGGDDEPSADARATSAPVAPVAQAGGQSSRRVGDARGLRLGGSLALPKRVPTRNSKQATAPAAVPLAEPAPAAAMTQPRDPRSLMTNRPDDLIISWTGPMTLRPLAARPPEMAGPDDLRVAMTGRPVHAGTREGDRLTGSMAQYLQSASRVSAQGSPAAPLRVTSPTRGVLTGTQLQLDASAASGYVIGPGELRLVDAPAADRRRLGDVQPDLTLGWTQRLDLGFYTSGDARTDSAAALQGLQSASFRGEVEARNERFTLDADRLDLTFDPPDAAEPPDAPEADDAVAAGDASDDATVGGDPRRIEAFGQVAVQTLGDPRGQDVAIDTQFLRLELDHADDGRLYPSSLLALRDVHARRADFDLWSQRLDLAMLPADPEADPAELTPLPLAVDDLPDAAPDAATVDLQRWRASRLVEAPLGVPAAADEQPADDDDLADVTVASLVAQTQVRVVLHDRQVEARATQLVADAQADRLTLLGSPAVLSQPDAELRGEHLLLDQTSRTVDALGSGTLLLGVASEAEAGEPNADDEEPADEGTDLRVTWNQRMALNDAGGTADFYGDVSATTDAPGEATHLDADSLHLRFLPPAPPEEQAGDAEAVGNADDADGDDPLSGGDGRRLREATAVGSPATLNARTFEPGGDRPLTRLRLIGDRIVFENLDEAGEPLEQVRVPVPGRMLIEDYRPLPDGEPAPSGDDDGIAFSGRGATLFLWQDRFVLDAQDNDFQLDGDVQMVHRPIDPAAPTTPSDDPEQVVQLDAQRLVADLHETGGLSVWLGDDPPAARLRQIIADRDVRIIQAQRTVRTDRMRYLETEQMVTLQADEGQLSTVRQQGQSTDLRARVLRWDLTRDRFEALDPSGGAIPVPAR